MTCKDFEMVVTDLACEFLMDAVMRKRALAHSRACLDCAARLQQEHALTTALSEATSVEPASAPAHVKTALLAAFQQQNAAATVVALPVSIMAVPRRQPRRLMAAAAAVALIAILVALQVMRHSSQVATPANSQQAIATDIAPEVIPNTGNDVTPSLPQPAIKNKDVQSSTAQATEINEAPRLSLMHHRKWRVFRPELATATHGSDASETVTEFIPLTEDVDAKAAVQNGNIVRVQLVRASLIAMGLPVNTERAQEMVKADIVVGDDGLARAIRLVY